MASHISRAARAVGCLLGGAIGDALGAPVEFLSLREIQRLYGTRGIRTLDLNGSGVAHITDDTQMTMFTAEGLLEMRAIERSREHSAANGTGLPVPVDLRPVLKAYHRWLVTQGVKPETGHGTIYDGMSDSEISTVFSAGRLVNLPRLHARRAPGTTCISSLQSGVHMTAHHPRNDSKGCGGVMRAAPAGIIAAEPVSAFRLGCRLAALTHGHPTGYIAAGLLSFIVWSVLDGESLPEAVRGGMTLAEEHQGAVAPTGASGRAAAETVRAVGTALEVAESGVPPSAESVEKLGAGWVAEEALAIGIYAALSFPGDLGRAVRLAVNHSGDSDSTGSICGTIVGAIVGVSGIPDSLCRKVELGREVRRLAIGLNDARGLAG